MAIGRAATVVPCAVALHAWSCRPPGMLHLFVSHLELPLCVGPGLQIFDLNSSAERPEELARPFLHECFSAAYADYGAAARAGSRKPEAHCCYC